MSKKILKNDNGVRSDLKKLFIGDYIWKACRQVEVLFVGDRATGKTSVIQTFKKFTFRSDYLPTGVDAWCKFPYKIDGEWVGLNF
jgi:GTPase SAR1 family protein